LLSIIERAEPFSDASAQPQMLTLLGFIHHAPKAIKAGMVFTVINEVAELDGSIRASPELRAWNLPDSIEQKCSMIGTHLSVTFLLLPLTARYFPCLPAHLTAPGRISEPFLVKEGLFSGAPGKNLFALDAFEILIPGYCVHFRAAFLHRFIVAQTATGDLVAHTKVVGELL
jgi:hypothetical protein